MRQLLGLTLLWLLITESTVIAQEDNKDLYDIAGEFAFVRIQYDSYYDGGWYGGPWATDFPASDENHFFLNCFSIHFRLIKYI